MVELRNATAALAALGLVVAAPAPAAIRAAQALPAPSAQAALAWPTRTSQPTTGAEALRGRTSTVLVVAILAFLGAILVGASDNGNGSGAGAGDSDGNSGASAGRGADSPG